MDSAPTRWIRTADELDDLIDELAGSGAIGIDTEADSLHHYTEKVCLIQLTAFRGASWLMSVGVNNAIRQIGAANVFHGYTVNLPEGWADQLFGKPVYESAYMPDTTTWTTTAEGQAIVGDFSNFVIARNGGMSVELVPTLFQQQTAATGVGFPTGQRGWFAYARIGSDVANAGAFRLLVANS